MWRTNLGLVIAALLGLLALPSLSQAGDPNLVAYWTFDEGTGTIAYDSAGGNDGTIYGANWTTGQIDGALEFDGTDDYVDCESGFESVTGSTTKSIMAWIRPYSASSARRLITLYRLSDASSGFALRFAGDPVTWSALYMKSSSQYEWLESGVAVDTGAWTHIALVQDGSVVDIYINGVSENSVSNGAAPEVSNPPNAIIGAYLHDSTVSSCLDGKIDDVRIYDRALSAGEVEQLYWEGLSWSAAAIRQIEDAIAEKEAALESIDAGSEKEWAAYGALEELLASGDYGDLSKRDIAAAQRKIESSIRRQERSKKVVQGSIEELEDALLSLGWELAPEPNVPEPNSVE